MKLSEILEKPSYKFGPIRVKTKDEYAKFNDMLKEKQFKYVMSHDDKTNEALFFFPNRNELNAALKLQQEMITTDLTFTGVDDKI